MARIICGSVYVVHIFTTHDVVSVQCNLSGRCTLQQYFEQKKNDTTYLENR